MRKLDDQELASIQITAEEIAGTVNDIWRFEREGVSSTHSRIQLDELMEEMKKLIKRSSHK